MLTENQRRKIESMVEYASIRSVPLKVFCRYLYKRDYTTKRLYIVVSVDHPDIRWENRIASSDFGNKAFDKKAVEIKDIIIKYNEKLEATKENVRN